MTIMAGCTSSGSEPTPVPVEETVATTPATAPATDPLLATPCFVVSPEFTLPPDWIAADVSTSAEECLFVLQRENMADTTVIAGELFTSSSGRTFDEFVEQMEEELTLGQEPDILALQNLNTGASGRPLPILERISLDQPNRAEILVHESDRRDGYIALSAVVDVPAKAEGGATFAIKIWGLLLPLSDGAPDDSPNYQLALDLINAMQIEAR